MLVLPFVAVECKPHRRTQIPSPAIVLARQERLLSLGPQLQSCGQACANADQPRREFRQIRRRYFLTFLLTSASTHTPPSACPCHPACHTPKADHASRDPDTP